jgi:hypothetical protein
MAYPTRSKPLSAILAQRIWPELSGAPFHCMVLSAMTFIAVVQKLARRHKPCVEKLHVEVVSLGTEKTLFGYGVIN